MTISAAANSPNGTGLSQIAKKTTDLGRYTYLSHIRNTNPHLFYRLVIANIKVINFEHQFFITS